LRTRRSLFIALAAALLTAAAATASVSVRFTPGLFAYVHKHWGSDGVDRVKSWREFLLKHGAVLTPATSARAASAAASAAHRAANPAASAAGGRPAAPAAAKAPPRPVPDAAAIMSLLRATNAFWNDIPYQEDDATWGDANYMPSPVETLGVDNADCKAYAIAKYFTLKDLGVPVDRMRLTYVTVTGVDEPHMVLAYYPTPDADPYILDNLQPGIDRASERTDLVPVYSFNDDDLWAVGVSGPVGTSSQIRVWRDLQQRMARENQY
jgi:predicted transglutaminase-like cysteine proteinase